MDNKDINSFMQEVIINLCNEANHKLEDLLIEGLRLKGFYFEDKVQLENFIRENCRCEDRVYSKQKTYFVNNIPFFVHYYEIGVLNPTIINGKAVEANFGYTYL